MPVGDVNAPVLGSPEMELEDMRVTYVTVFIRNPPSRVKGTHHTQLPSRSGFGGHWQMPR